MTDEQNKTDFNRIFANLPLGIRNEIIYVDEKYGAMTWQVVRLEVEARTKVAVKILEFLKRLKII